MLGLAPVMLAEGAKGFFENPEYLLGIPLVLLGAIGVLIVLSPLGTARPRPPQPETEAAVVQVEAAEEILEEGHPSPAEYVRVGLFLGVVTALEVAVYYIDLLAGALIGILLALSTMKFVLVVLWFMHLQFDSRLFSTLFAGGLALVMVLFIVVLATLGASLV